MKITLADHHGFRKIRPLKKLAMSFIMIALIDYGMGNLHSVNKALEICGGKVLITHDINEITKADKVVLPGVGAIGKAKEALQKCGIWQELPQIINSGKAFLGICLGMQMLFDYSEEGKENVSGLGIIPGAIKRFPPHQELKVPHMGWNQITIENRTNPFLKNIPDHSFVYFVHSYYAAPTATENIAVTCQYGKKFTAAVQKDNLFASQFHPEKSQEIGLKIIKNFVEM